MSREPQAAVPSLEEKRETLARLIREKAARRRRPPLTSAQERMWFLQQLDPGNTSLNVAWAVELEGTLEVAVLEATVSHVVERHEALRTTFAETGETLVQVIADPAPVRLPVIDLEAVCEPFRGRLIERLAREQVRRPFDLEAGPLLRVGLLRADGGRHVLLLTVHHIVTDGWSMILFAREITAIYEAFAAGRPSPLPKPEVQYADHALRQRRQLSGEDFERQLAYWSRRLAGAPPEVTLPADRGRAAVPSRRGRTRAFDLPADVSAALKELGRQRGMTNFMTLLAAFQAFLSRSCSQRDLVVASPIQGRKWVATESLIGLFVNTLCFRVVLAPDSDFSDCLAEVRTSALEAYAHQDLPFEKVVEELRPERDLSRTPLANVIFVMQSEIAETIELPGLRLTPLDSDTGMVTFDLEMNMRDLGDRLDGWLTYSTDLFDDTTIRRFLGHFRNFLAEVVEDAGRPLSEAVFLGEGERHQLAAEWNDTARPCPQVPMVHEVFSEHARRRPDHTAIVSPEGIRLTYGELEQRSNLLAHHLRSLGVGPEVLVAMCTGRSLDRAVGILGVVKAGGAYVSIDPSHPEERLAFLLADAGAEVLLSEQRFAGSLPSSGARVLSLDSDWGESFAGDPSRPPASDVAPDNLAYVVYTSGSTGKPKGVAIPHAGLMNLVRWHQRQYSVSPEDRGTQVASPSFDASIWEFWPYLAGGASLYIPDEETRLSSSGMVRWWSEHGITLAYLMTPLAEGVLEEQIPPELALEVRALIIGGDRLHRGPDPEVGFRLMNHYGPAEYSVTSTVIEVPPEGRGSARPTIGRAIDNTEIFLLDRRHLPVPIGVPGELWVAGTGLARSYLRRPKLTAEKFLPHFRSAEPGARMYRTGDQVRWLPDGDMDFLGRLDHQVKLRGLRIELGEIEAALTDHPAVREAAVVVLEARPGDKRLAAYLTPAAGSGEPEPGELTEFLHQRLPAYMTPRTFVVLDALPLSPNGKVDRKALPTPDWQIDVAYSAPGSALEEEVAAIWAEVLGVERVGMDDNFFDLGGHSLMMVRLKELLAARMNAGLALVELFQYPTVRTMAQRLDRTHRDVAAASLPTRAGRRVEAAGALSNDVAVIGMAGRFPGAPDVETLWRNLCDGVEAISHFSDEELIEAGTSPELISDPRFVPFAGVLEDPELFDAEFFGFSPREAQVLDPQHRLFLESAWQALEDAGYGTPEHRGAVGLFAGTSLSTYLRRVLSDPALIQLVGIQQVMVSNDKDHLPTRVSYKLNLHGPSVNVQTACSTALVAVHLACQSLVHGECDMALAGGVSINVPTRQGHFYEEGGIMSPDGHCRAFDRRAKGTVDGNGVGVVVLKPLRAARADRDSIHAVIKGTAINNDGSRKVGYTAPSVEAQAAVIAEAQEIAGFEPETIGYVEAHGSGTPLGDPIEILALSRAFRRKTDKKGFCAVGSVKSNLGHLDAAAGVAGLIKTVMAVRHGRVPPSLHFESPNPEIDFESSAVYVNSELRPWPLPEGPRRAGVSSFGIGGTNAHVVLEEAPEPVPSPPSRPWHLLVLSARSEAALERSSANLANHLKQHPELDLADVAYTSQVGRQAFGLRRVLVPRDLDDAVGLLEDGKGGRVLTARDVSGEPAVAFMFPGLGEHYVGMGRGLFAAEPRFREALDECVELLIPELGSDLREVLYPEGARSGDQSEGRDQDSLNLRAMLRQEKVEEDEATRRLGRTAFAQPALFALEYALARLWTSWGIRPQALVGYSLGEYVAACLAGVFSLQDATRLVARRAQMIQQLPPGGMIAVPMAAEEVRPFLGDHLSISATTGHRTCVVGGPPEEVSTLEARLSEEGFTCRKLATSHAFHSKMMEPIADSFRRLVRSLELRAPRVPFVSNVSGDWIREQEATDPDYWVAHLLRPVRFAEGINKLWQEPRRVLLEVGPGQTLGSFAVQQSRRGPDGERPVLSSLPSRYESQPDRSHLLRTLGRLWLAGSTVDWKEHHAGSPRSRLHLPTYPFERRRHWVEPHPQETKPQPAARKALPEWTYLPSWKLCRPVSVLLRPPLAGCRLVFSDETGLGEELVARLSERRLTFVTVHRGETLEEVAPGSFRLDPHRADHYEKLLSNLEERGERPRQILHMWTVTTGPPLDFETAQELGFYSLFELARALAKADEGVDKPPPVELTVVSNGVFDVSGSDESDPAKSTILGPIQVIPREMPHVTCRVVDLSKDAGTPLPTLAGRLLSELECDSPEDRIALRGARRWSPHFEAVPLPPPENRPAALSEGGAYLITGGLGGLGLLTARYLAKAAKANLVLLNRSGLPEREKWPEWTAGKDENGHGEGDVTTQRIRAVEELEKAGSEVLVLEADVSEYEQLERAVGQAREKFGRIHGVFHTASPTDGGLIRFRTREAASRMLATKAEAAFHLSEIFRGEELDCLVFYSSLDAFIGGPGQVDYAAANACLDALAHSRNGRTPTMAINWDGWQEVGMAARMQERFRMNYLGKAIKPEESENLFDRLLNNLLPQVAVSTTDLAERVESSRRADADGFLEALSEVRVNAASQPRPALHTPYEAPRDQIEECLAEFWQQLLGLDKIGIHDNFYELGGDSLLATRIASRVWDRFGVRLKVDELLSHPTLAELALIVGEYQAEELPESALTEMAAEIKGLSEDELTRMLESDE